MLPEDPQQRQSRLALLAALLAAGSLAVLKFSAYASGGSVSLLASAWDSGLDFLSSLINFGALIFARRPADLEHRFGHGKAEAMAGLAQSLAIFLSAGFILYRSFERFLSPVRGAMDWLSLAVMVLALLVTITLVIHQRQVARRTGSLLVAADSLHYAGDVAANIGVILAIVISPLPGLEFADPVMAGLFSFYIFRSGGGVFKSALDILLDRDVSEEYQGLLDRALAAEPLVRGYHDLRARSDGSTHFLELHLELPANLPLSECHAVGERVSAALKTENENIEILVHFDQV